MVRRYLLSAHERKLVKFFVEKGLKLNGFSQVIHHMKKNQEQLHSDLDLIDHALKICGENND